MGSDPEYDPTRDGDAHADRRGFEDDEGGRRGYDSRRDDDGGRRRSLSPRERAGSPAPKRRRSPSPGSPPREQSPARRSRSPSRERGRQEPRRRSRSADRHERRRSPSRERFERRRSRSRDRFERRPRSRSRSRDRARRPRSRSGDPYGRDAPRRRSPSPRYYRGRDTYSPPRLQDSREPAPRHLTMFVAGFNFGHDERDVEHHFGRYGRVTQVRLVKDFRTGRCRGFGFVAMSTEQEVDDCIHGLHKSYWEGRQLLVEKAKTIRY